MKRSGKKLSIKHTLKISTIEGIFAQIHLILSQPGSAFLTKLAVLLNATPVQFGLLASIGQLTQIFQPLGMVLTKKKTSRKKTTILLAAIGRSLTFLCGVIPFFFSDNVSVNLIILTLFLACALLSISGNIWIGWVSDIVPMRFRGRFFAKRSQFLLIAGGITGYICSWFIDLFNTKPGSILETVVQFINRPEIFNSQNTKYGLISLFALSSILGLIGLFFLGKQQERPKEIEEYSLRDAIGIAFRDKNFRKLLTFGVWWMLAVGIGAPFWQPYMIQKLHMSLADMQLYTIIFTITSLFALKYWGKVIDFFGNKIAMRIAIVIGSINPLFWLIVKPDTYWIVYIDAASSGVMWSVVGVVFTNFVLSVAPKQYRQIYSGLYGAFTGAAMMITMLLSGYLMPPDLKILGHQFQAEQGLFFLTAIARLSAQIPLSRVHEPMGKSIGDSLFYFKRIIRNRLSRIIG